MGISTLRFGFDGRGRAARATSLLGVLAVLAGCAYTPVAPPAVIYEPYRAGAPDELLVTILPEPVVQEDVIVRPDGLITIQLVGEVLAGGRTLDEISSDIENRISKYKRGARVTVALKEALSQAVTVLGEVRRPGSFPLVRQTRVAEALGTVGGVSNFANTGRIRIIRSRGGEPLVIPVDLGAIRSGDMTSNVQVYGGDIVYVPPTALATIGYAVNQLFFPFSPFIGIATSALGTSLVR
jgi:polysaccharide biosynthesis/export protein